MFEPTEIDQLATMEMTGGSRPDIKARVDISTLLNVLLADFFSLYVKTKNFHWHISGPHFREYHRLLDKQADAIFATIDPIAERVRKLGGSTIRSIGHIGRLQRIRDNETHAKRPSVMFAELRSDNAKMIAFMQEAHDVSDRYGDVATASLLENWIDEAERRVWFLFESNQGA